MKVFFLVVVLLVAAVLIVSSCKKDEATVNNAPQEFAVKIDSVKFVKNPRPDTLRAQLWGRLGNSTCYSFSRYATTRDSFQVQVRTYGNYTPSNTCGTAIAELRGAIYRIPPPFYSGLFTIIIQQPDGSTLRDTTSIQ